MKYDMVTIGSATVDHFADTDSELIRIDTPSHHEKFIAFPLGSKLLINELKTTVGGGGTNTAVSFSRLGLKTAFLGKIGDDAAGEIVMSLLKQEQVDFLGAREGQTGFSVILNSFSDDRSILAYKGANDHLKISDIGKFDAEWIYLSSMMSESWDTVVNLVANGQYKVAFNPSNYQAKLGYAALSKLVDRVTILVMNREEACKFLGKDYKEQFDIQPLLKELYQLPPEIIVITDGSHGAFVYNGHDLYHAASIGGIKVLETTGAGDAFASAFTGAFVRGETIETALDYGMTNAESVIQYKGAKEKLLTWNEVSDTVSHQKRHIEKIPM